ncbi:MAG: hypothetical protein ACD_75C01846G0001, partial [uncultured bacterium]
MLERRILPGPREILLPVEDWIEPGAGAIVCRLFPAQI